MPARRRLCGTGAVGLAAALYAFFSSPTPDAPGFIEYAVIALLAIAAVLGGLARDKNLAPLALLLAYGFTAPLAAGALAGHDAGDMARDLVAFSALALPLLLSRLYGDDRFSQNALLAMMLGVGLVFSLRFLMSPTLLFSELGGALEHDYLYLANSPLVAFASAWLLLQGCFGARTVRRSLVMVLAACIPIAAQIGMMQRATLALLALAWLGFLLHAAVRAPRRAAIVASAAVLLLAALWPLPAMLWEALADKTLAVGWNARGSEIAALLDAIQQNPFTMLFGAGWGALLKSPAVGDVWVRFSHSLLTSLLWKTGWAGFALGLAAMAALVWRAAVRLRRDIVTLAALILPLIPALFLYGSYKSFCFGLLLLGFASLNWTKAGQG